MKMATVADLRNNFATISRWIYEGESVTIKKRGKVFATLSPVRKKKLMPSWPDFAQRLRGNFPTGTETGAGTEELVDKMRGDY